MKDENKIWICIIFLAASMAFYTTADYLHGKEINVRLESLESAQQENE